MTADLKICPYFRTGGNVHDRYGLYQTRSICLRVVVLNVIQCQFTRAVTPRSQAAYDHSHAVTNDLESYLLSASFC